jgi:hypothetical protein
MTKLWSLCILGCLWVQNTIASETNTNVPLALHADVQLTQKNPSPRVLEQYSDELIFTSRIYYDRFRYPSLLGWVIRSNRERYDIHDSYSSIGQSTVKDMLVTAARETFVDRTPFNEWEQSVNEWGRDEEYNPAQLVRFSAWIIRSSVGNTEEHDMEAVSAQPSYHTLRYLKSFKWQSDEGFWDTEYGWRPFRDKPYVYFNNNFGHFKNKPFIRNEIRCYGYLRPNDFGLIKAEGQATITTGDTSQVVIGGKMYPSAMSSNRHKPSASIRLESLLFKGVGSVGATTSPDENFYSIVWWKRF